MARKTNKTAHVLNLISKAKDEHQAMEEQMQIDNTGSDVSNDLLFMGIEPSNDKSISEKINENLESSVKQDELGSMNEPDLLQSNDEPHEEVNTLQEIAAETDTIATKSAKPEQEEIIDATTHIETEISEAENADKENADTEISEVETSNIENTNTDHIITEMTDTASSANESLKELPIKTPPVSTFHYVNVYEALVKERLEEFQRMFDVCTCPRCTVDVIAFALTNLPAKYIVSKDSSRTMPLLSFYREKFKTSVAAQLSHACIVVKQNPYH